MSPVLWSNEVIQMGIEAEKIGIAFYESLVEITRSIRAKNVFSGIAQEKKEHLRELERLSDVADGCRSTERYSEEYSKSFCAFVAGRVFTDEQACREMAGNMSDESDAARLASNLEKEMILFLYEMRRLVPEVQRDRVERLLDGEYEHLKRLHALGQI